MKKIANIALIIIGFIILLCIIKIERLSSSMCFGLGLVSLACIALGWIGENDDLK